MKGLGLKTMLAYFLLPLLSLLLFDASAVYGEVSASERTAREIMDRAAENCAENVIRTAEISFSAKFHGKPPSQEKIDRRVKITRERMTKLMEQSRQSNPAYAKAIEEGLKDLEGSTAKQMVGNSSRTVVGIYFIGGPSYGGDRLVECRVRRGYETEWGQPISVLLRNLGIGHFRCLVLDGATRTAIASGKPAVVGFSDPHYWGRLRGNLLERILNETSNSKKTESTEPLSVEYHDADKKRHGEDLIYLDVFSGVDMQKKLIAKVAVSPEKGFVCPYLEEYNEQGEPVVRWESKEYFKDPHSNLWFPGICEQVTFSNGEEKRIEFTISAAPTRLNVDFPPERFAVTLPKETSLISELEPNQQSWNTSRELSLTVDDLDTLSAHHGLVNAKVHSFPPSESVSGTKVKSPYRIWMIIGNLLVMVFLVAFFFHRRRNILTLLVAVILSGTSSSCSRGSGNSGARIVDQVPSPHLVALPEKIELGTVSADGQEINSYATFVNNGDLKSLSVHLSVGCGCANLGVSQFQLNPGERKIVPFSITTAGRNGFFSTSITVTGKIEPSSPKDRSVIAKVVVPLTAHFVQSIFASPSRVVLSSSDTGEYSGRVSIHAPFDQWDNLTVSVDHKNASIKEVKAEGIIREKKNWNAPLSSCCSKWRRRC